MQRLHALIEDGLLVKAARAAMAGVALWRGSRISAGPAVRAAA